MTGTDFPLISVVIPVFNGGDYLKQAVSSVMNQSYPCVQLVLVDGGSTDGSKEWIEQFAAAHACTTDFLPPGTPAAHTWTRASELAEGTYVTLLCQDDVLYPPALQSQWEALKEFPEASMVSAKRDIIDSGGRVVKRSRGAQGVSQGLHAGQSLIRVAFNRATNIFGEPLAVLFRTEALLTHLPWDDTHPFMLDMDMYGRVLAHSPGVVSHSTVGAFRVSNSSWSTHLAKSQEQQFQAWLDGTAARLHPTPTKWERHRAGLLLREQILLRRLAYAALAARSRM